MSNSINQSMKFRFAHKSNRIELGGKNEIRDQPYLKSTMKYENDIYNPQQQQERHKGHIIFCLKTEGEK